MGEIVDADQTLQPGGCDADRPTRTGAPRPELRPGDRQSQPLGQDGGHHIRNRRSRPEPPPPDPAEAAPDPAPPDAREQQLPAAAVPNQPTAATPPAAPPPRQSTWPA